jgi:predicted Zn-dependent protease
MMPNYLLQNPDDSRARIVYAHMLITLGKAEIAVREANAAIESAPGDSVMLYNAACLYAKLNETRRAIDTLRQAISAGVTNFQWMKHDPDLNSLRADPEFIELTVGK